MKISYKNVEEAYKKHCNQLLEKLQSRQEIELFTSGSTGRPKRILLRFSQIKASAEATLEFLAIKAGSRALLCLPVDKVGGLMMLARAWLADLELTVTRPQAQPLKKIPGSFDFSAMTPHQAWRSVGDLERIETLILGGGEIAPAFEKQLSKCEQRIYHSYGMTETLSHVALRSVAPHPSQFFRAMPGVLFAQDERNCLIIKAPHLSIERLVTNDVVQLQDQQHFQWLGRYDNVVNSGGLKMYPEQLEKAHPAEFNYFLCGQADEQWGQSLVMVLEKDQRPGKQVLRQWLDQWAKFERPKKIYEVAKFIETSNGKLKRKQTFAQSKNQVKLS